MVVATDKRISEPAILEGGAELLEEGVATARLCCSDLVPIKEALAGFGFRKAPFLWEETPPATRDMPGSAGEQVPFSATLGSWEAAGRLEPGWVVEGGQAMNLNPNFVLSLFGLSFRFNALI